MAKLKKSNPWTMKDLEAVLRDLKRDKFRDFEGYINEIFMKDIIGTDLKKSLLMMFNGLKVKQFIPQFMNFPNITTIHKTGF